MIEYLSGLVAHIEKNELTIVVGGIGLAVSVPQAARYILKSQVVLHTHLYWHKDNGPAVFGFDTVVEKKMFLLLLDCSGVGPKIALGALGSLGVQKLATAIATQDVSTVSTIPGIGRKKAEAVVVFLKDKANEFLQAYNLTASANNTWLELNQALSSLGYSTQEINQAMAALGSDSQDCLSFDRQLRKALQVLSGGKL